MIRILAVAAILMALGAGQLWGQNTFPSSGNVGIGTTSPSYTLTFGTANSTISGSTGMTIQETGDTYGAVSLSLQNRYGVNGAMFQNSGVDMVDFVFKGLSNQRNIRYENRSAYAPAGSLTVPMFEFGNPSSPTMVVADNGMAVVQGTVGIGTSSPCANSYAPTNCKLSVAGAIQAQLVVVNSGWSDYVFSPGYRLRPLNEVSAFIQANHHLPDIPSEAEVKEKGVDLGDMQAKLLAKVEELTLHMIQAEERSERLERQVQALEKQLAQKNGSGSHAGEAE
jgi:hypothetical protein